MIKTIRLNHGKANILDLELCRDLERQLREAEDASAVILTGMGAIFSAGVDLVRLTNEGVPYVEQFLPALDSMLRALFTFPRPVVAAVNGHAIAGGCILAAASDVRLMAAGDGRIGVPELIVGVPMPSLILEICRFAIPQPTLQELIYRGATLRPEDALRKGVIDEVVEPAGLEARALAIAEQLAAVDPTNFNPHQAPAPRRHPRPRRRPRPRARQPRPRAMVACRNPRQHPRLSRAYSGEEEDLTERHLPGGWPGGFQPPRRHDAGAPWHMQ